MIRKFKPFWSFDLPKIEQWLTHMSEQGYRLSGLNRVTRGFHFQKGEAKEVTYRISYDKLQNKTLPATLQNEGWELVTQNGNWSIIANEQTPVQIKTSPVRDGILKRNRIIMYVFLFTIIFFSGILLNPLLLLLTSDEITVVESPLWAVTYTFFGLVLVSVILGAVSIFKIRKSNKQILNEIYSDNVVEQNVKGPLIVKRKIGWMYAPDKLQKWLEDMEAMGYNLQRVGKSGVVFYFKSGKPRKMAYSLDYQNLSNESYFMIHQDLGWKKVYSSPSPLQKWTIWGCEYDEEKPTLYSDRTHMVKHAKKVALSYTVLFLPLVVMNSLFIISFINQLLQSTASSLNLTSIIMFLLSTALFGSFIVRIWLYYMRLKKRTELA